LSELRAHPELRAHLEERALTLRRHVVSMVGRAGSGHPGGSLSAADIVAALYFYVLKIAPDRPDWPDRDRFVLSKGHAAPVVYAALAERGYFPVGELAGLRRLGSMLQGHPDMKRTPGIDASTGSLGQGLSIAGGMALAARLSGRSFRVYALLGDGELQEGQVWEAAMSAVQFGLENLTAIIDYNGVQLDGRVEEIMDVAPLPAKWLAFGWHAREVDGHDVTAVADALEEARGVRGRPQVIVARTVKGKGVSFMENQAAWHGKAPTAEQVALALDELRAGGRDAEGRGTGGRGEAQGI
jgi:transketolase